MIDLAFWWAGAAVFFVVFCLCASLLWQAIIAFAVSVDLHIWMFAIAKKNEWKTRYGWWLVKSFLWQWWDHIGVPDGTYRYSRGGGEWKGFRNWEAWKIGVTGPVENALD